MDSPRSADVLRWLLQPSQGSLSPTITSRATIQSEVAPIASEDVDDESTEEPVKKKRKSTTKASKEAARNEGAKFRVSRLAATLLNAAREAQFEILDALEAEPVVDANVVRRYKERLSKAYDNYTEQ